MLISNIILKVIVIGKCIFLSNALSSSSSSSSKPIPINGNEWPHKFPAKEFCSRCGLCETTFVSKVNDSCAFINGGMKRNIDSMEQTSHGRNRRWNDETVITTQKKNGFKDVKDVKDVKNVKDDNDELRFGVMSSPIMLGTGVGIPHAQWTGCVTGIAVSMLEAGMVDAVVCIASKSTKEDSTSSSISNKKEKKNYDWSEPEPILARTVNDVLRGRGVKPALAPSLKVLDEIKSDDSIQNLLFCGVGCAVQGE